ncbi:HU family DNA-binding protein [Fusobacterium sp.]|uniref:HU family DNA-binding protein n=1 Tax=Fusobacterium sp. TaxID=68766 RepID=UPI0026139AEA|nr:HU family DNA-binding protein [Fusobacterium sp.]
MTTKQDLIIFYSELNKIKDFNEAEKRIDRFINTLFEALKFNDKIAFMNFGTFEVRETKERDIVDPKDSSNIIRAKSKRYVKFKVSKSLEDSLYIEN